MREVLDRLREAETALDNQLNEAYFQESSEARRWVIEKLWQAKSAIWYARMSALQAAAGSEGSNPN